MRRFGVGFTLVEIMVCLAIISLVAAISVSAYGNARWSARQTTCVSNMRQIHVAMSLYRQDYDGSDSGTDFPSLGLPEDSNRIWKSGYINQFPRSSLFCPNETIDNPEDLKKTQDATQFRYMTYHGYDKILGQSTFLQAHLSSSNPFVVFCPYHDISYWRTKKNYCDRLLIGLSLSGSIVKYPESVTAKTYCIGKTSK
jgi:prepilin-type N-terminal cleavage/methylation domain-containing protein